MAGAWKTWRGARVERLVRLDGGLYPGFDGAPVADAEGRFIGIASSALSRHHAVVLPVETVGRIVGQIMAHGHVPRGYLGIAAQPVRVEWEGRDVEGLLVSSVADVILQIGSTAVGTLEQLRDALEPGQVMAVRALRGDRLVEMAIAVAQLPSSRCG